MKYLMLTIITFMVTACAPKHVGMWVNETGNNDTAIIINKDNTAQFLKDGTHQLYTWAASENAETPGSAYFVFKGFKTGRSTTFDLDDVVFYTSTQDNRLYLEGKDIYVSTTSIPTFKTAESEKKISKAPAKTKTDETKKK